MIPEIIQQWDIRKNALENYFRTHKQKEYCGSYKDILIKIFEFIILDKDYNISKITVVDDGDYQGTQIFLIPEETYQPSEDEYLITSVGYGSCSGCDTLQSIHSYNDEKKPSESQVSEYMTLALHLIQKMKKLNEI